VESTYCIYKHTNKINKKVYIGQTCQKLKDRWKNGKGYKTSTKFYNAILKHGWENFEHEILKENLTNEEANYWEQYYIKEYDSYKNGYNGTIGGNNAPKTEEHKQKISQSNIGKHNHNGKLNPMYGKKLSNETKNKIREKQKCFKVRCIETGEIFDTCHLAAAWCGLQRDGHIPNVCRGERQTAGGYHWEFIEGEK
jgi:group I intron endonuclease